MQAVRFHEYGEPEVLRLEDVPDPQPGPGEAVVRVRACGVNRFDLDLRSGRSRMPLELPHTLGLDGAGEIAALGSGTEGLGFAEGQRVIPLTSVPCGRCRFCQAGGDAEVLCHDRRLLGVRAPGNYAEYVLVPAESLVPMPDAMSFEVGAAIQTAYSAAWRALTTRAQLQAGETVLVNAAGSASGSAGIQIGKLLGARVIASAGSEPKLRRALEIGADEAVSYENVSVFADRILALTGGVGVDVVMESVGGEVLRESLRALAPTGRIVTFGAHAGEVVPVDIIPFFRNEHSLLGSVHATVAELRRVIELAGDGKITPVIDRVLPLAEAQAAHKLLEDREQFGKIVLTP